MEGDIIEVINTGDGNWWLGRLRRNKTIGVFPCNFVEFIDEQGDSPGKPGSGSVSPSPSPSQLQLHAQFQAGNDNVEEQPQDYSDHDAEYHEYDGSNDEDALSREPSPLYAAGPKQYKSRQDILRDLSLELNGSAADANGNMRHGNRPESRQSSMLSTTDSFVTTNEYTDEDMYRKPSNSNRRHSHYSSRRQSVVPADALYYESRHQSDEGSGDNYGEADIESEYYDANGAYFGRQYNTMPGVDGIPHGGDDMMQRGDVSDMPNTPPMPPKHASAQNRALNRTPSPLRSAMEDVLESLENLNASTSPPPGAQTARRYSNGSNSNLHHASQLNRHSSDRTHMQAHRASTSGGAYFDDYRRHAGGSSLDFRTDATMTGLHRGESSARKSATSVSISTGALTGGATFGRSRSAFISKDHHRSLDLRGSVSGRTSTDMDSEEEGYIPFDPSSYDHLATTAKIDPEVERADTYRSMSSVNTNSLSIVSTSTTPTSVSSHSHSAKQYSYQQQQSNPNNVNNSAIGSAGVPNATPVQASSHPAFLNQNQRQDTDIGLPTTSTNSNIASTSSPSAPYDNTIVIAGSFADPNETPVVLPNAKVETAKPKSSGRSLKLRKSTGFIRKLFSAPSQTFSQNNGSGSSSQLANNGSQVTQSSGSAFSWTRENQSQSTLEPETTTATTASTLKRTKSRSSRLSMSSTSSRFRTSIKNSLSRISTSSSFSSKQRSNSHHQQVSWMEIRRDLHRANTVSHNEREQRIRRCEVDAGVPVSWPFHALVRTESQVVKPNELKRSLNSSTNSSNNGASGGSSTLRQSLLLSSRFLSRTSLNSLTSAEKVDGFICNMNHWPQIMTPAMLASSRIAREFSQDRDRLRAIFMFCASKIVWRADSSLVDDIDGDDTDEAHDLNDESPGSDKQHIIHVLPTRQATTKQFVRCVRAMCEALDIGCRIVSGHLKHPLESELHHLRENHFWNSVYVDGEWQLMDVVLANKTFAQYDCYYGRPSGLDQQHDAGKDTPSILGPGANGVSSSNALGSGTGLDSASSSSSSSGPPNDFYFLTAPDKFIFTHIPADPRDQLLVPALSDADAMGLPIATPEAFQYDIKFVDYYSCATKLYDLELAQLCFQVGLDVEVSAEVVIEQGPDFDAMTVPALAQAFWENNQRYFRVKAFIPDPFRRGVLNIFVGSRGAAGNDRARPATKAYVLNIEHRDNNEPFEFVMRHPTPHSKRQDIYVKQPQCKRLIEGSTFVFSVDQHPCGTGFTPTKLAVQSPSGKIIKLQKVDYESTYGTWESTIRCSEVGTWRGLVLADSGSAWSVFAEWYCV